jgi:hypothetical protein
VKFTLDQSLHDEFIRAVIRHIGIRIPRSYMQIRSIKTASSSMPIRTYLRELNAYTPNSFMSFQSLQLAPAINISYNLSFRAEDYGFSNGSLAAHSILTNLDRAISTGNFTSTLRSSASSAFRYASSIFPLTVFSISKVIIQSASPSYAPSLSPRYLNYIVFFDIILI